MGQASALPDRTEMWPAGIMPYTQPLDECSHLVAQGSAGVVAGGGSCRPLRGARHRPATATGDCACHFLMKVRSGRCSVLNCQPGGRLRKQNLSA